MAGCGMRDAAVEAELPREMAAGGGIPAPPAPSTCLRSKGNETSPCGALSLCFASNRRRRRQYRRSRPAGSWWFSKYPVRWPLARPITRYLGQTVELAAGTALKARDAPHSGSAASSGGSYGAGKYCLGRHGDARPRRGAGWLAGWSYWAERQPECNRQVPCCAAVLEPRAQVQSSWSRCARRAAGPERRAEEQASRADCSAQ